MCNDNGGEKILWVVNDVRGARVGSGRVEVISSAVVRGRATGADGLAWVTAKTE